MTLKTSPTKSIRNILLGSAIAFGVAGYGIGQSGLLSITPSYAEAVKVDAPAVFSFGDVVEAVSPAVVSVRVEASFHPANAEGDFRSERRGRQFFEEFFQNGPRKRGRDGKGERHQRKGFSQGSGFFVSDDGYVVTNNHVIEGGSKFTVVLADGEEHKAKLIGTDPRTDLAVLKIEADQEFTYVDFGDNRPRIGDWVVAVGNPFGLGGTVTAGIVSAHGREIGASRFDDFIQIDAAVNKGNSGGPAFNLKGEVVGVNTAIFSPSGGNVGIAFAIPASLADEIVTDLIEDGSVSRGWLGVQIQPVTEEIAEALGLETAEGAIVTTPQENSPADEVGLEASDVITSVDGEAVKGPRELSKLIAGYEPNSNIKLNIWRDGKQQEVQVELGELENASTNVVPASAEGKNKRIKRLGVAVEETDQGIQILRVRPDSRAERLGLREGDMIVAVNGEDITSIKSMRDGMKVAKEAGRKSALLEVRRSGRVIFVPVPVRRG